MIRDLEGATQKPRKRIPSARTTMSQGKKRRSSGRKCRCCGRDPWPNMFFCATCHGYVSSAFVQE